MAAYAQKFVVSVLGPKDLPLREKSDSGDRSITLPFDSEYKLRLINKHQNLRARVQVKIDGMDVSPGREFILAAGQSLDLERFILDGDLAKGNKFKFMSLEKGAATGEIQDPTSALNGRIEVRFWRELTEMEKMLRYKMVFKSNSGGYKSPDWPGADVSGMLYSGPYTTTYTNCVNPGVGGASYGAHTVEALNAKVETESSAGATTLGGLSNQQFQDSQINFDVYEHPTDIVLFLKGPAPQVVSGAKIAAVQAKQNLAVDPSLFAIMNPDGGRVSGVDKAEIFLDLAKSFVEVKLYRRLVEHNGSERLAVEFAVIKEIKQFPMGDTGQMFTQIDLGSQVQKALYFKGSDGKVYQECSTF